MAKIVCVVLAFLACVALVFGQQAAAGESKEGLKTAEGRFYGGYGYGHGYGYRPYYGGYGGIGYGHGGYGGFGYGGGYGGYGGFYG